MLARLSGGLGNQLFQYAAARAIALRNGAELSLDTRSFARDPLRRRYALERFPICAVRRDLVGWRCALAELPALWRIARATGWAPRVGGTRFLYDRMRALDHRVRADAAHLVLTGYWQDERYFLDALPNIAAELDPISRLSPAVRAFGESLDAPGTLAIHVRRADFANTDSPHGTCSASYYANAVRFLRERSKFDRIVVFTDDAAWVQSSLGLGQQFETLARSAERDDVDDLWLMSRCPMLVISNSSYSWWAARLAELRRAQDSTLVVCPARWYRPLAGPIPHPAPERWHRLAGE